MTNRSSSPAARATRDGTARFSARGTGVHPTNFYRPSTFDLTVSSVGIGTYLGEMNDADDQAYERALQAAVARGVNLIDTAINYRGQRSERAVGAALQRIIESGVAGRDEIVVCTKGGYIPLDRTTPATRADYQAYVKREFLDTQILHTEDIVSGGHSLAPRFLRYCLAKSRQNLGVRTIDVYYLHNPEQQLGSVDRVEWERRLTAAIEFAEEAVDRGDIGIYGLATWDGLRVGADHPAHVSLERVVDLARIVCGDRHHLRAVQAPVSLAMPEAASAETQAHAGRPENLLSLAAELGLSVIGSATLLQGRLTANLPEQVRAHFVGHQTDAQRAIAFARSLPGLTASLVGMKQIEHVDENLAAPAG